MINKSVCFSGHRPEKLPGKGIPDDPQTKYIKDLIGNKIQICICEGYTYFISGVARGIDLWAAKLVIDYRTINPQIKLICVKPVANQGYNFPEEDKLLYDDVVANADTVICTSESYRRSCYMIRNKYMVDNSDLLIAFVKEYKSGTGQTIKYASGLGKKTDITDLSNIQYDMCYKQLTL